MLRRKRYDLEMHDEAGVSLLMMAAARGYDDVLELLVINGANFNARSKNGISALMLACENVRSIEYLFILKCIEIFHKIWISVHEIWDSPFNSKRHAIPLTP